MDPRLIQIGLDNLPVFIGLFRALFHKAHPDDPIPTDADLIAAAESTFASEHAKNLALLKSHPATD